MVDVLSLRDLNRTTLARQLLLERAPLTVPDALARLVALQGQVPSAPYVALWSRLAAFEREDLTNLLLDRSVVKATSMRATLHVLRTDDHLHFRPTLAPIFDGAMTAITKKRGQLVDQDVLLGAVRPYLDEQPRTFAAISAFLAERWPHHDVGAMRYTVRMQLPLVQVPQATGWGFPGNPAFALADSWLGRAADSAPDAAGLVRRYLAAFGPATPVDMQSWTGLGALKPAFDALGDELIVLRDDRKRTLFDLAEAPRPGAAVEAPVRYLAEFDNVLSGHKDRTRFIADHDRPKVYLPALRVAPTVLIDGFVAGVWRIESAKNASRLVVRPFASVPKAAQHELVQEGERLARFLVPTASHHGVEVESHS